MKQMKNILYEITCGILIFFFGLVFLQTIGNLSHMDHLAGGLTGIWKPFFLCSGAAILLLLHLGLVYLLNKLSSRQKNIVLFSLACIGAFFQFALIFFVRPCLQCDALKPIDTAMSMLNGIPLVASEYYEYFSIYPHNLPLTLYIFCIFKLARIFGAGNEHLILLLQIANLIFLDFALFQLYRLIRKKASKKAALGFAALCFLNPLLYYYPVFFYTQALSIPIFVFMITLFFQILDADTGKKRILYGALYGLILFLGWKIRFFTLITLISCGMYLFFHSRNQKRSFKEIGMIAVSALTAFTLCLAAHNLLMDKYSLSAEAEKSFPIHHWIMMGLGGDGTFYYVDEDFTRAIPTKSERAKANTELIKTRIENLGPAGLLNLWGKKLSVTWADGFDDYASNLILLRHYRPYHDWISGYRLEYLAGYLHIYNCMTWMLLTVCAVKLFKRKLPDFIYAVCITILGGMMFHLIWEAGEPYSMPFALLITAAASLGLDSFFLPSSKRLFTAKQIRMIFVLSTTLFLVTIGHLYRALHNRLFSVTQIGAIQNLVEGDYLYLENNQTLTQTVICSRPFNTLTLRYKYYDETNEDTIITMRLSDSSGRRIIEEILPLKDKIIVQDFSFPEITPNGREVYTIELMGTKIPEGSRGGFTAYNTGFWDVYPEGNVSLDGQIIPNSDLCFELTNQTSKTFF